MAIRDLLWACPLCRTVDGIRATGRTSTCAGCGATFRRTTGARIEATPPGGAPVDRPSPAWADLIGEPTLEDIEAAGLAAGDALLRTAARVQVARRWRPVRTRGRFLGRVEELEAPRAGVLTLRRSGLTLEAARDAGAGAEGPAAGADGAADAGAGAEGPAETWPPDDIGALVASSSSLQIRHRDGRLFSLRFPDASLRLWDAGIREVLRAHWRAAGKGEIREFQPRITT